MLMGYFSQKILQENILNINKKRCINISSKAQRCTNCRDICPANAITISNKSVNIDHELCTQCSICRAACPSQAIALKNNNEIKIIKELNKKEIIVVGCNKEGNEGNVTFSCIHGLHKEYLAALLLASKDKKIYFNLCKCENCNLTNKNNYFESSLNNANTFISYFDVNSDIELLFNEEDIPQYHSELISRRDLFTLFKKQSTDIVSDIVDDTIGREKTYIPRDFILAYIDDLLKINGKNIDINESEPFFTNWNIKDNCNGCGVCETVCPSNAWKIEKENKIIQISHNSRKCISCGLCSDLCNKKSLVKNTFSTNLLKGFVEKKEVHLNSCKKCDKEYIPDESDIGFCHICEKRNSITKSILGK